MADPDPPSAQSLLYYPPVETHLISSRCVTQTFKIDVLRPAGPREDRTPYPVVYAIDANVTFDVLKGISRGLQLSGVPEARYILVGIGYPGDAPSAGVALRARDFTFRGFPNYLQRPLPWGDALEPEPGSKSFEGGEDFQRFLSEELLPFIDETYATMRGDRTYFGHSLGGTFGLYSLFTAPSLFRRYIIASPAVSFEDDDFGLREVRRFLACGTSFRNVRLYLAAGTEEEFDPAGGRWRFTSSFYRLAALLKSAAPPGLVLTSTAFPGEGHMTVWPGVFMHGIRAVFCLARASRG
jgi:uncharacterized protein